MLGIDNIASFLLAATLVIIVPGPATFYVAGRAQHSTRSAGLATAGIVAGDVVLITLAGAGFAALVSRWPMLLQAIQVSGALYIAYLGVDLLRASPAADAQARAAEAPPSGGVLKGFLITLTNPKPILFFGAFFPVFIDKGAQSWMGSFYALGGLFEVINLLYFAALITVFTQLRNTPFFVRFAAGGFKKVSGYGLVLCGAVTLVAAFA
ncbi:LysE family transporter [Myxococcaceae bacterium JPH2]|nr:LysE family transporter [Myxococcaceae bacterium JPH2]